MKTIRIDTFPVSTNNMYVGKKILTSEARVKKAAIAWEANEQYTGELLEGPLSVVIIYYWPDLRTGDIDNIKGLLDALTGVIWKDDGQIVGLHLYKKVSRKDPRIEIEVVPHEA